MTETASQRHATANPTDDVRRADDVGVAWAGLIAWLAVGLGALPAVLGEQAPAGVKTAALAWHFGQCLAAGAITATAVGAWRRRGPRSMVAGVVALAAAAAVLARLVALPDVVVAASKLPLPDAVAESLLTGGVAALVPGSLLLARRVHRVPLGRLLCAAVAMAVLAAQQLALPDDYLGVHFFVVWTAAIWAHVAALPLPVPRWTQRTRTALHAVICSVAAFSLGARPANSSSIAMLRAGSALSPWVLRLHALVPGTGARHGSSAWLADRSQRAPVEPSKPSLLAERPIVLLITVDALRADVLSDARHTKLLPNFTALREQAVDFQQMRSTSPGTNASIASLFSSKHFSQLYWTMKPNSVMKVECPHLDDSIRFPDVLSSGGVTTVNITTMAGLDNDLGLARGFTEEHRLGGRKKASAAEMAERAVQRIREAGDNPLFLWMHLPDAHAPYDLGGKRGTAFDRYLREVALVDGGIGKIRRAVDELGLAARTTWVVSADHGEAFGEHGTKYHATTVYDELLRVPLLVVVPGVEPRVVGEPVSLLDVAPTILDLFGQPTPGAMMGESLVPFLRGRSPRFDRPIVAESSRGLQAMVFPDRLKVILDRYKGTVEVYDLARDPGEVDNVADDGGAAVDDRVALTREFFRVHEHRRPGYSTPSVR